MAERVRFELTEPQNGSTVFETVLFNHSSTSPYGFGINAGASIAERRANIIADAVSPKGGNVTPGFNWRVVKGGHGRDDPERSKLSEAFAPLPPQSSPWISPSSLFSRRQRLFITLKTITGRSATSFWNVGPGM